MTTPTLGIDTGITRWGSDLAVRLNKAIANTAGVAEGSPARTRTERGCLVITALERRLTLDEMRELFDPVRHSQ
jgi:antitoxin component of MazEF toxin-antitoxin module